MPLHNALRALVLPMLRATEKDGKAPAKGQSAARNHAMLLTLSRPRRLMEGAVLHIERQQDS